MARNSLAHTFLSSDAETSRRVLRACAPYETRRSLTSSQLEAGALAARLDASLATVEATPRRKLHAGHTLEHAHQKGAAFQIFLREIVCMRIVAAQSRVR